MKKSILILTVLILTICSCDKDFDTLNENPLAPTNVRYEAVFNELVNSLRQGWNRQLFLHNEILYDVTELAVVTAKTFGNTDSGAEEIWNNYYSALKNARQLENTLDELSIDDPQRANVAKAQLKILMAYKTFQLLDLFGDIPYSEAGRAFETPSIIRPVYDDGKEVYLSLMNDLQAATDTILVAGGGTALGNDYYRYKAFDTLFGDDLFKWQKFSNSLLLKYAVRIYNKEPELVTSIVENMLSNGYQFLNPGEDVVMSPREQSWFNQGVNWSFREHNKVRMGTNIWSLLTDDGEIIDPRAGIFFETNNAEEWVPFPQISDSNTPQSGGDPYQKDNRDSNYGNKGEGNIYSPVNFYLVRDEQDIPEVLLSAAEVKFLMAEVFLRGIGTPIDFNNASFRYTEGMLASMDYWQAIVDNSAIWENQFPFSTDFFSVTQHPKYVLNFDESETEQLTKIYTQRWLDCFRQPWEAFSLIRQTNLIPREKGSNDFYRFQYPNSEAIFNAENWSTQVEKMGGDETDVKLWWMD